MSFLIRRRVRIDKRTGGAEFREFQVPGNRITIGRASDQHLQIANHAVAAHHAIIQSRGSDRLYIKSLQSSLFQINGKPRRSSALSSGDSIQIGPALITVEKPESGAVVLTIDYGAGQEDDLLDALHKTDLTETRLSKRSWSWVLMFAVSTLFLLIPLSGVVYPPLRDILRDGALIPDDNLWSSGPLHLSHQFIGKDCNVCHKIPFQMVRNQECIACHADIQHHVDVRSPDVLMFQADRCANCHREHNEPDILVQRDPRLCSDCHENLKKRKPDTKLGNVVDFAVNHPEFRPTILVPTRNNRKTNWQQVRVTDTTKQELREPSFLKFSHKDHLNPDGIESPDGDQVLTCPDCHKPMTSGRYMMPIVMEVQCSRCHQLLFDENDPDTKVPHGNLEAVYKTLKKHFSHQFLAPIEDLPSKNNETIARRPGQKAKILSRDEQKRALDWTEKRALLGIKELLEDRLCSDCHQVSKIPGTTGIDQWHLEPIALTGKWMPLARFSHAAHENEDCTICHKKAEQSEDSNDVLMPGIATCRECHGDLGDANKVHSDCLMCHQFHLPNRGLFDPVQRKAAEILAKNRVSSPARKNDGGF